MESRYLRTEDMTPVVGSDDPGIVTVKDGKPHLTKFATNVQGGDCIDRLLKSTKIAEEHKESCIGIGHTRWATCGSKDDINAHPHFDQDRSVFVVHNGTILNYRAIKEELLKRGVQFTSETDSEVIAQLIAQEYKECKDPKTAILRALEKLEGTYGLLVMFTDHPDKLYCLELGSHLVIGIGEHEVFIGSEARAFQEYTQRRVEVEENQLIEIGRNEKGEYGIINFEAHILSPLAKSDRKINLTTKGHYATFYEKEINDQEESIFNSIGKNSRIDTINYTSKLQGLQEYEKEMSQIDNIYLFGCGTSHISASLALHFFKMINHFESIQVFDPSDFSDYDMPKNPNTLGIFISQSGETRDVIQIQQMFKKKGLMTMGICNVVGSKLAKETDFGVYMHAGYEQAVPSTKTMLASTVVQILVALWFSYQKTKFGFLKIRKDMCLSLLSLPAFIRNLLDSAPMRKKTKELAEILKDDHSLLCIGKGAGFQSAREAALKLKEVCYIHAEAIGSGDLKHGPISLIDSGNKKSFKIILFIFDDERFAEMTLSLDQVNAREAYTIIITDCYYKLDHSKIDFCIEVQNANFLSTLLAIIPIQLVCLHLAELKGINPDKPRNLAKTVTVN